MVSVRHFSLAIRGSFTAETFVWQQLACVLSVSDIVA